MENPDLAGRIWEGGCTELDLVIRTRGTQNWIKGPVRPPTDGPTGSFAGSLYKESQEIRNS